MENSFISARILPNLSEAIEARIKVTGESRSQILLEALRDYLGIDGKLTTSERLDQLEGRMAAVEETISKDSPISLEGLSVQDVDNLNRDQLAGFAKQLGVYSYKLTNSGLKEAILTQLQNQKGSADDSSP